MSFVDTNNTGSRPDATYGSIINKIATDGVCPFCPDHLKKYHKLPIVEHTYWWATDNMYPYKPSLNHGLFIHKAHIKSLIEISPEAWSELHTILKTEIARRNVTGGTFAMRFGDTHFTGASVSHLHAHLIQSTPEDEKYDKKTGLLMRIG